MKPAPYDLKIAASVIAGDNCGREDWERMSESLVGQVDYITLSWNGKGKKPPKWMINGKLPCAWVHTPWSKSFADQRNVSWQIAVDAGADWVLWIDTDDELLGDCRLAIAGIDESSTGIFCKYEYGVDPENGSVTVEHWRERLLSTATNWQWRYRIHEVAYAPPGTQMAKRDQLVIRHHRDPEANTTAHRERNRELVELSYKESSDPRFLQFLANEHYADAENGDNGFTDEQRQEAYHTAIGLYKKFITSVPGSDDGYIANHRIADIYRTLGQYNEAIDVDLQGVKLRASWPDSYNGIATACLEMGNYDSAIEWSTLCMTVANSKPTTTQVIESLESDYQPYLVRGTARDIKGDHKGAWEDLTKALAAYSTPTIAERVEELRVIMATPSIEPIPPPLASLHPMRNTRPEKSIAFINRPTFEAWHPEYEKERGMGGAETCIMRLAPRFAADGWRVSVFGSPGEHEGIQDNGVEWWNHGDFISSDRYTVAIASRAPEIFDAKLNAEAKFLWLHDVNVREELFPHSGFGGRLDRMDGIITLTAWHRNHIEALYAKRGGSMGTDMIVIPNGLEAQNFTKDIGPRDGAKFVYASSPDRGLDVLLGMWEEVRDKWPTATLDVFYGWASIDAIIRRSPDTPMGQWLQQFKASIDHAVAVLGGEEGGIFWKDRIPQAELNARLYDYTAWLYPTFFMETFCITALEMQAAGVLPVTSNLAALQETVKVGDLRIDGWPNNMSYRREWVQKLEEVMWHVNGKDDVYSLWQGAGRAHALRFDWDDVYGQWLNMLSGAVGRDLTRNDMTVEWPALATP